MNRSEKQVKLLDCTLRDGAYLIDKKFGSSTIKGIIKGLIAAKMDVIEIGFLQNEGFGNGKTVYRNERDAAKYIPAAKGKTKIAVLADYSRYDVGQLEECSGSIDIIRECFFKHERKDAVKACHSIKKRGYQVVVQPVDILGYSDLELIGLLEEINDLEPYGVSIVDTFGSMYQEDLHRIFELIHYHLEPSCRIGFHSHNNMQMSNALSQEFIRLANGKRQVIVDGTLSGMGRGAGNTPTELITQYLVSQHGYSYDIDILLDLIDIYIEPIRTKCSWGYSTSYFVAGCYGAHVNNIDYLSKKSGIRHKDMRLILNKIGAAVRKRYDYDLLEHTYMELIQEDIDDSAAVQSLRKEIGSRPVLMLLPGETLFSEAEKIDRYIVCEDPVVISVNFIDSRFRCCYVYMNNVKRYQYWSGNKDFQERKKILTSNVLRDAPAENAVVISFKSLVKCGWECLDNSAVMLLRLLDIIGVKKIAVAGFDGYKKTGEQNYFSEALEVMQTASDAAKVNQEIQEMIADFCENRRHKDAEIKLITTSRFSKYFRREDSPYAED